MMQNPGNMARHMHQRSRPRTRWILAATSAIALVAVWTAAMATVKALDYRSMTATEVAATLRELYTAGQLNQLAAAAQAVIDENPTAARDLSHPSAYQYLGVAQYALGDLPRATRTFEIAVQVNAADVTSWVHLGNCYLYQMQLAKATSALEVAVLEKGATHEMHRLFKARNWMADWQDRDEMLGQIERRLREQLATRTFTGANPLDFAELPTDVVVELSRQQQVAGDSAVHAPLCCQDDDDDLDNDRVWSVDAGGGGIRVGFVSSDFGVHPVATLLRGMLAMLTQPAHRTTVFCFSLTSATSWWRRNITKTVDHVISLVGKDPREAAAIIQSHRIHVLVDLNGHTLHSGLPILSHRPAPVQVSFLGYPMTTGHREIDWFVTDAVSSPIETATAAFTEKLLVLPTHYIVNDHMQMLGHTLGGARPALEDVVSLIGGAEPNTGRPFVFATFSNWQKMDPPIFATWMTILARVPGSVMWFLEYSGHVDAAKHLREEALAHGIDGDRRLVFSPLVPWINHTFVKRVADLVLDTSLKNGHTTMIDALCAGVPVLTLEGTRMSNRAGSSALRSLDLHALTVNSFKEYADVAVQLATDPALLAKVRGTVEARRLTHPLFDTGRYTERFAGSVQAAWSVTAARRRRRHWDDSRPRRRAMHVFPAMDSTRDFAPQSFPIASATAADDHVDDAYETRVVSALNGGEPIFLHIGGMTPRTGWWIVDLDDRDDVDFVMPMSNLYVFPDASVSAIYASHVLEHCHYGLAREVRHTLLEWHRVLKPGGAVFISVPDLAVLSGLFVNATLSDEERFFVMRMVFGGQVDRHDVHKVGFDRAILTAYLKDAGFCEIQRVDDFGLFADSSVALYKSVPISLNLVARACKTGDRIHIEF